MIHDLHALLPEIGLLPDALEPDIHCVRTHWIRGFMTSQLARRTRIVVLMVPAWPEPGFRECVARHSATTRG